MFRFRFLAVIALAALLPLLARSADPLPTLNVWPKAAPGEKGDIGEEKCTFAKGGDAVTSITNVSKPTLTIYRPAKDKNTGCAVVIAPGGGYNNLAWEHEGTMVGEWLQSIGVTGVLLKYRVPRRPDSPKGEPPVGALQDAQRAISITRANAKEWGIDPNRIGMLGFSAGGHLTAWAATNSNKRAYDAVDDTDKVSCRPDFAVLIYPGGLVGREVIELSPEIRVSKDTPPCFFALAYNDNGPLNGSLKMIEALKKAGVKAELHVYSEGGHGFGMRAAEKPHATWPKRCEEWMKTSGFLTAAKGEDSSPVAPGAKLEKLAGGFKFTEGPAPDAQGNVYFTDQPNDRIHIWSTDGKLSTFMEPCGRSNGLSFDKNGILWACADEKNELWKIDVKTKEKTVVVKDFGGKLLNGPNDVWVRDDGSCFFSDPYYKRPYWKRGPKEQEETVYFVSAEGKLSRADVGEIKQPNGIIGTPDGKLMYVADIGAGKTYQYDVAADGKLSNRKVFCSQGSDGMTIDDKGNVYFTLGPAVTVYDKTGAKIATIPVPENCTNVCFGGTDMKTLFITAGTSLYSIPTRVKGVARQ